MTDSTAAPTITPRGGFDPITGAIRALAMDSVQKANSGHPGADGHGRHRRSAVARLLKHNPANPDWANRDRFVLSNGHGSMLLYALLHLTGYDLSIDDLNPSASCIRKRRATRSAATPGVETTTGPLGQGHCQRGRHGARGTRLAAQFNRPGHTSLIITPTPSPATAA
jgi:transketolase